MNILVDEYRRQFPDDARSDDEITLLLAAKDDGTFSQYEDFASDVARIRAYAGARTELNKPTIPQEFTRGLSRGADSLKQSAYGVGALAADVVGATSARDTMLKSYVDSQRRSEEEDASAVPRVEDVKDVGTGVRFALGKAGELVPQIGEALLTGAAGAVAGSAIAPGPGTVAGLTEGFVARQSAKALIKAGVDKILSRSTLSAIERNVVKDQLEKIAEKKAIGGVLHDATKKILSEQIKSSAANMGSLGANLLNFYGIGSGTIYGDLASREGVDDKDARNAALIGGIGSALANAPLPAVVLSRYFPGVAHEVANKYLVRLAKDAAIEIPIGATGEALDELVQIAAEKYADPKRRDTPLDDQDLSRLLNAAVVGAGAGAIVSPVSAINGGQSDVFGPEIQRYFKDVDANRQRQLVGLATRQELGNLSEEDINTIRLLNPQEQNFIQAFTSLSEEQRNKLTADISTLKGGESNEDARKERQREGQGPRRDVLNPEPQVEQPEVIPPVATPEVKTITDDQTFELNKLGYDDNDIQALNYDEAVSIIATGLKSPKAERRAKFRAKAVSNPVEETAADAALKVKLNRAAKATNPNPTPEQAESGNYQKGKVEIDGLNIEIESPRGELRQNKPGGEPWSVVMKNHYGQILGTKGSDGDPIDIYIGDKPASDRVWVVDQIDPATKEFDEHKALYGFETPEQAIAAYDAGFSDGSGPSRRGRITEMGKAEFKKWVKSDDAAKPLGYQKPSEPTPAKPAQSSTLPAAAETAAPSAAAASDLESALEARGYNELRRQTMTPEQKAEASAKPIPTLEEDAKSFWNMQDAIKAEKDPAKKMALYQEFGQEAELIKNRNTKSPGNPPERPSTEIQEPKSNEQNIKATPKASEENAKSNQVGDSKTASATASETSALTVDDVDVESRGTYGSSKRGKTKADSIVEPAWFRPTGQEAKAALEQRLLSDRGTPSGSKYKTVKGVKVAIPDYKSGNKQLTKRLTAILDNQTGQVHLVSTYPSSPGIAAVTIFNEDVRPKGRGAKKDAKSAQFRTVMDAKLENGNPRYEVLGSMRTKELTEFYHQVIPSREQFEQEYGRPLDAKTEAVRKSAAAVEEQQQQVAAERSAEPGKKKGEPTIVEEHLTEENIQQKAAEEQAPTSMPVEISEAPEVELSESDARLLATMPDFKSISEYAQLLRDGKITIEQTQLLKRIKDTQDPDIIVRLRENGTAKTLEFYDKSNAGRTNYAAIARPVESTGVEAAPPPVRDTGRPGEPGANRPEAAVAGEQNSAGVAQPEGAEGNAQPDTTGGEVATTPVGEQEVSPEHARLLDDIYTAAAQAGLDVNVVQGEMRRGNYSAANRTITHVLGSAIGSHDVRIAYHEVLHDVFSQQPEEIRSLLTRSIESLNDNQIGIDTHPDPRIRESNPDSLTPDGLQEERLVAAVENRLVVDGFNPRDSAGYARSFVRAIKEALIKVAMDVQRMFGFEPSPKLALAYFENSAKRFLAGDAAKYSFVDMLGLATPKVEGKYQKWFKTSKATGERLNADGVVYDHQPNTTDAGAAFNVDNALKHTLPVTEDVKATRTIMVEREVAAFNHLLDLQMQAVAALDANEAAAKLIGESGKSTIDWLRKTLRLSDPQKAREAFNGRLDFDQQPIEFNPEKRLQDFKDESNKDYVLDKLYRDTQGMAYRVDGAIRELEAELQSIEEQRAKLVETTKKAHQRYTDLDEQARLAQDKLVRHVQKMLEYSAKPKGRRSTIASQLKVLDATAKPESYAGVFENLVASKALTGKSIIAMLDVAANTPTIDFNLKADEIRKSMRESGKFNELVQDTPSARARLATVIAIAKSDPRLLAELELRRLASGRAEIDAKIAALVEGKANPKPRRTLTRQNSIEDRILAEYSKVARKLKDVAKGEDDAKVKLATMKLVEPVVNTRLAELTGLVGATTDFTFKDGAPYHPVRPGMTTEKALATKAVLGLNSAGEITDPKLLEQQATDMKAFLMEREERYAKGDLTAKDKGYQTIEREYQELAVNLNYRMDLNPSDRLGFELHMMPEFTMIGDGFGTPAAQLIKRSGNHYARVESFLKNIGDGIYDRGYRIRREMHKLLPGLNDDNLQTFIDMAKLTIEEQTSDLVEAYASQPEKLRRQVWVRVRDEILKSRLAKDIGLPKVIDKFMPAFERLNDLEHEMGDKYFTGQVLKGIESVNPITGLWEPAGLKVKDPGIKVLDDKGNLVDGLRRHFKKGWRTFGGRRMSDGFSQMAYAMRQSGFATFEDSVAGLDELYRENPEAAIAKLNRFFNHPQHGEVVNEWFVRMLAERQMPMFEAPVLADGVTTVPADPMKIRQALDAAPKGDVAAFIQNLYDLHEGETEFSNYFQQVANQLAEYSNEVQAIAKKYFPDDGKNNPMSGIRRMSPNVLIDAREISGLPSQWFSFHKFDKPSLHRLARHIAAEVAFGRDQEYLAGLFDTVGVEAQSAIDKLKAERNRVHTIHPDWTENKIEAEVKKMPDYKNLIKFEQRAANIGKAVHKLGSFFRKDNSPDATMYAFTRVMQTVSHSLLQQPASAIYQDNTNFDLLFRYNASRSAIKATLKTLKGNLNETVASLARIIGMQMSQSDDNLRFNRLGLQYAERVKRYGDEFRRWDNEGAIAYGARVLDEAISSPINLAGSESQHIRFKPLGLFDWRVSINDRAITYGMWQMAGGFISKGVEFYRNNPSLVEGHTLSESDLKLGRDDANTFKRLKVDMQNFGLDFDQMVKSSIKRNDGNLISDEEATRLHHLTMFLVSSQQNIATMPASAWNNNVLRPMLLLLGWMIRRSGDVLGKRLDENGQTQARALAAGVTGLAAATVGGLALSAIVDKYYEELVNRKRNLRPMNSVAGLIEHTARAGTFGMFGELANGVVTTGAGGDNRVFSLDKRVLALSSFTTLWRAASSLYNQEQYDWQRVGRPIFSSTIGNGLLHYLDMANNMLGLDNAESRISARINAQNYLRVVGRDLDLSVREFSGGSGSPTPMTPYITQMEMAAYANDAVGFRNAYQAAIRKAKEQGFDDPVDHVKRSFSAKNPLRIVFQTSPSEREYNRILIALPEAGREAVSDAVNQFNRYAESIGARAFEGRKEKSETFNPNSNPYGKASRLQGFRQALFN